MAPVQYMYSFERESWLEKYVIWKNGSLKYYVHTA